MSPTRREFVASALATGAVLACDHRALAMEAAGQSGPAPAVDAMAGGERFTRGVGQYPGEQTEFFGPVLVPAGDEYRNLALLRPAYHSSSYDYNLTAQLVTDGIATAEVPTWIAVTINDRIVAKEERESLVDHAPENLVTMTGAHATAEFHLGGGSVVPEIDRVELFVVVPAQLPASSLRFLVSTSVDGHAFEQVGTAEAGEALPPENFPPDMVRGTHLYQPSIVFKAPARVRYYRVELLSGEAAEGERSSMRWQVGQVAFFKGQQRVQIGGPYQFTSAWKSAGLDEEWVYVDLLATCAIDSVKLHWVAAATKGSVQTSDDAVTWHDVHALAGTLPVEEAKLSTPVRARYVRVLMLEPSSDEGYVLSELEVFGRGGLMAKPQAAATQVLDGALALSGGSWRVQRDSLVQASGAQLATVGFADTAWVPATVPGTALVSYLNAGALPDPNFGRNQLYISDSFFYADFWYRTEFETPPTDQERTWICLDGVNWKAEVFLNGERLGRVDGAFFRGRFDVTGKLKPGHRNALAVRVEKNATPGSVHQKTYETPSKNGGALGADNPTFHASVGWDWIPTIRGRNTGLWGEVRVLHTGHVTLEDPLVSTKLDPQSGAAAVTIVVRARNHSGGAVEGTVSGQLGDVKFSRKVTLKPNAEEAITFDPSSSNGLRMQTPKLWWATGYGEPHLYDASLQFQPRRGRAGVPLRFQAGLREMTSTEENGRLKLYLNGRRFIARGGNWGFSESMLRYRAREYDAAVRYHREMNFNMVRNWVGQIGEDAFYEACDRHGIVVWQDFWLANPWDGPIPDDNTLFLSNARDLVQRVRRHASIGIYCGRNEGFPPAPLESGIRALLRELHPDIHYIPSSADAVVSGHGPYHTLTPIEYFRTADVKLHSEIGAPTIPPIESVLAMMPEDALWPQGLDYGLHDFTLQGAQGAQSLLALIANSYGGATNGRDWIALAQFLNYDTYRAMFEAQSRDRMGVLLWMSHPCWPSFVWQTYDYYLEPTAAYFGCKKACEAIHIQWNPLTDTVEVVNYNGGTRHGLQATAELLNPDGSAVWSKTGAVDSAEDSVVMVTAMEYPAGLASIHFCRLTLRAGGEMVSTNTYLRAREAGDLRGIRHLGQATVQGTVRRERHGAVWVLTAELKNTSAVPALLTRVKAVGASDKERILPAIYEDNYLTLLPGEERTIRTELRHADTRGQEPALVIEGFNVLEAVAAG